MSSAGACSVQNGVAAVDSLHMTDVRWSKLWNDGVAGQSDGKSRQKS